MNGKRTENFEHKILKEIKRLYFAERLRIKARTAEFRRIWEKGSEEDIFAELAFCIFTPQSKAGPCWETVNMLSAKGLLLKGGADRISRELSRVRFRNNKAKYLVEARGLFTANGKMFVRGGIKEFDGIEQARDWLVRNVKGLGLKEASHFLRNIGMGEDVAILDRHVLKNLYLFGVIEEVPANLSRKRYLDIEKKMKDFAKKINIPMSHLDLVLWCRETGEIFK